jgi:DNA-binding response OmpR family regulator
MGNVRILWVDDEIDMLRPHIIFLSNKGYEMDTVNNGNDALEKIAQEPYDLVFLDENMPGLTGIEVLVEIKKIKPHLPVIMITKSEEESIMEDAIGSNIADYLIKPVNPNQILLAIKKNIDSKKIISEKNTHSYQMEFRQIGMELMDVPNHNKWVEVYKNLVDWELKLEKSMDEGVLDILMTQKEEANSVFSSFVQKNYVSWIKGEANDKPVQSHTAFKDLIMPDLKKGQPTFLFMVDNLRFDQWKTIFPELSSIFRIQKEEAYYAILPTATQYARNAFFSGLVPSLIAKKYPQYWVAEHEEGSKNQYEKELFAEHLKRYGKDLSFSYHKILSHGAGKKFADNMHRLMNNDINIVVYNFVDMLSHARTEMEVIRELASDDKAYRSLTRSWFVNSPLMSMMRFAAEKGARVIVTTDHGSIRVKKPVKVLGDRNVNTNLRYKFGKNLDYKAKDVFAVRNPDDIFLPKPQISTSYIFCRDADFFVYPNNYNHYASYYKDTFQHGGISLEEMIIPLVTLTAR